MPGAFNDALSMHKYGIMAHKSWWCRIFLSSILANSFIEEEEMGLGESEKEQITYNKFQSVRFKWEHTKPVCGEMTG